MKYHAEKKYFKSQPNINIQKLYLSSEKKPKFSTFIEKYCQNRSLVFWHSNNNKHCYHLAQLDKKSPKTCKNINNLAFFEKITLFFSMNFRMNLNALFGTDSYLHTLQYNDQNIGLTLVYAIRKQTDKDKIRNKEHIILYIEQN